MTYTPRYNNVVELLDQSLQRYPQRPLFGRRMKHGWHFITYAEFGAQVTAARGGLASLGVRPGDRVAVISDNRLEWEVCAFAVFTLGAVYVPMYQAQLDKDFKFILGDSGAKLCLCANDAIAGRVQKLQPELPALQHIVQFDTTQYEAMLEAGRQTPVPQRPPAQDDLALLIYTSGTTGDPKGVELTHKSLGATASAIIEIAPLTYDYECTLSFLPWAHVFGGCIEVAVLIGYGGALAICDNTDRLIEYLAEVRPTALFAVPRIWNRIYEGVNKQIDARPKPLQKLLRTGLRARTLLAKGQPLSPPQRVALELTNRLLVRKITARLGGRVRFAVSGAAGLSPEVAEFIDSLGIIVLEGYGLTETAGGATGSKPDERKIGSVGKPLPGVEIKLDPNVTGVEPGEGEIIIYGPVVMRGYHNRPEETARSFTPDGGLRSGDLGRFDDDGYLYITGRVKELYKLANGKYVAPAALEEQLQLSPYISQVCVFGTDKPHNTAVVIVDLPSVEQWAKTHGVAESGATAEERNTQLLAQPRVRELIRNEVDHHSRGFKGYEHVRDFVLDYEAFTTDNDLLTPTLKLKRRNVVSKYGQRLNALYPAG